ncbi:oxidoreductase [Streptomyces sp. NPDC091209]|uniref:DUF7847 domain-containing protein n=1 Tax=Streptomyces sp. NPDC091209 TaxID=3365974 RepID=UPI0037F22D0B
MIPLAPLGVDTILGGVFTTMGRYAKPLFGLAALFGLALVALVLGAGSLAYAATAGQLHRVFAAPRSADWTDFRAVLVAFGSAWFVALLGTLVVGALIQASSAATLHDAVLGRPAHVGAVWRRAWARTPSVLGAMLLTGLIVMVPMALFGLLFAVSALFTARSETFLAFGIGFLLLLLSFPLTVWLYVLFSFAPAAAVLEGASPVTAMRRSARLIRGAWWRTFGISMLGAVIVGIGSSAIRMPLMVMMPTPHYDPSAPRPTHLSDVFAQVMPDLGPYLVLTLIATLVTQLLSMVFMPLVTNLLYIDQRIRREGLADVLIRAAADPGTPVEREEPGAPGTPGSVH